MKNCYMLFSIIWTFASINLVTPTPVHTRLSFLVNTEKPCLQKSKQDLFLANTVHSYNTRTKRQINGTNAVLLTVSELKIKSNINNRYANTVVTSKVANTAATSAKEVFSVILPNDAFVIDFVMDIGGKNYTSYVVDNEEARRQFDSALSDGLGAGYVAPSTRDSNIFIISINVEPNSKVVFYLTYQELLKRKHGRYENIIDIHPGQPVQDLSVEVSISERQKLKDLKALPLRTGNEIGKENANLDPKADIKSTSESSAVITFSPNIEEQKQFTRLMNTPENKGLAAQFVVQYDVERDSNGGEMLTKDCFFVNFFAPSELKPISKLIIFLLDTSGSMGGNKLKQLKEAMAKILDQLHDQDMFYLVEFSNGAKVWNLDNSANNVLYSSGKNNMNFPNAYPANSKYIMAAKNGVNRFTATGGTDALAALEVGLQLIETATRQIVDNIYRQAVMVFLTDGIPNGNPESIITKITQLNTGLKKSSIFSLAFGNDANDNFLQKLSLRNNGTFKHIYESTDSVKQLETFYNEISSPVLLNIVVNYNPSQVSRITKTNFPVLYYGSEIVIAGQCGASKVVPELEISATSSNGSFRIKPVVKNSLTDVSRLWAYVTAKDLLDQKKINNTDAINKEIVDLSLNYSFVTGLSSMVVTSPHKDVVVGTQELGDTARTQSHPKASAPNPNYQRPTSTTTSTTTTTTTPVPTTPALTDSKADLQASSQILLNLSLMYLLFSYFYI